MTNCAVIDRLNMNCSSIYGLVEIIKIIQSCDVIIGNETGPICLASSLKKKVHSIYLPIHTKPESQIINVNNTYYNTNEISDDEIIKSILNSIKY